MLHFFLSLMEITLSMSAVILLLFFFLFLFGKKLTAKCRYRLLCIVVVFLLIPIGSIPLPNLFTFEIPLSVQENTSISSPSEENTGNTVELPQQTPMTPQPGESFSDSVSPSLPIQTSPNKTDTSASIIEKPDVVMPSVPSQSEPQSKQSLLSFSSMQNFPALAAIVIVIGAVSSFLIRIIMHILTVRKLNRSKNLVGHEIQEVYHKLCKLYKIQRPPALYSSPFCESPLVFGFIKRRIFLPVCVKNTNAAVGILAHELTHLKRGDLPVKALCLFASSLHWFNPLVQAAIKRCIQEMELSCDETVLKNLDENVRRTYGNILLDIIRKCQSKGTVLTTHFNPRKNAIKERFMNIMDTKQKKNGTLLILLLFLLCLTAGTILGCHFSENTFSPNDDTSGDNSSLNPPTDLYTLTENGFSTTSENLLFAILRAMQDKTLPAEDYSVNITDLSVPVTLDIQNSYYLTAIHAHNQTITTEKLPLYGDCNFSLFEAQDAVIVSWLYYFVGNTYILSENGCDEIHPDEIALSLYLDENKELKYYRCASKFATVRYQDSVLSRATSREDFLEERGKAFLVQGKVVIDPPEETLTLSDVYNLDEEFDTYNSYYSDLDSLFESNQRYEYVLPQHSYRDFLDEKISMRQLLTIPSVRDDMKERISRILNAYRQGNSPGIYLVPDAIYPESYAAVDSLPETVTVMSQFLYQGDGVNILSVPLGRLGNNISFVLDIHFTITANAPVFQKIGIYTLEEKFARFSPMEGAKLVDTHKIFVNPYYLLSYEIPEQDVCVYYTADYGNSYHKLDLVIPDKTYDSAKVICFGGGGGSGEAAIYVELKIGDRYEYVSFNNFHYTTYEDFFDFQYGGTIPEDYLLYLNEQLNGALHLPQEAE